MTLVRLDLLPQVADDGHDGAVVVGVWLTPDLLVYSLLGQDPSLVSCKKQQQVEFLRGKLDGAACRLDDTRAGVDGEAREANRRLAAPQSTIEAGVATDQGAEIGRASCRERV